MRYPLILALLVACTAPEETPTTRLPAYDPGPLPFSRAIAEAERALVRLDELPVGPAWQARAPGLRAWFTDDGQVHLRPRANPWDPTWSVQVELAAWGREGALEPVTPPERLAVEGARIELVRPDLSEWYLAREDAIEQGFVLDTPPGGDGEVVLALDVAGGLRAVAVGDGIQLVDDDQVARLAWSGLVVRDAEGDELPSQGRVEGCEPGDDLCQLVVSFDDADAAWPIEVDPLFTDLEATRTNLIAGRTFAGYAVDVSGDRALVGIPGDPDLAGDGAAVMLYRTNGAGLDAWGNEATFDEAGTTLLGAAVALDYPYAAVGAPGSDEVFVYEHVGGAWTLQVDLTGNAGADFGGALALDGDALVIGAPGENQAYAHYRLTAVEWAQVATFNTSGFAGTFGAAVAVSGPWVAIGAPTHGARGIVRLYERNGIAGLGDLEDVVATVLPSESVTDAAFGAAIALEDDRLVVGAPGHDRGRVFVFEREASDSWPEVAQLEPTPADALDFGQAVALSGDSLAISDHPDLAAGATRSRVHVHERDAGGVANSWGFVQSQTLGISAEGHPNPVAAFGDVIVAGAPEDGTGTVKVLRRSGTSWIETAFGTLSDDASAQAGTAVALEGDLAAVGAPADDSQDMEAGAVFVLERDDADPDAWLPAATLLPPQLGVGQKYGQSVALSAGRLLVGAPKVTSAGTAVGAAYLYERDGASWTTAATFTGTLSNGDLGDAVALDGDLAIVGAPGVSSFDGEAYAYERNQGGSDAWGKHATFSPAPVLDGRFGDAVAVDGPYVVIGAKNEGTLGSLAGEAYVYERIAGGFTPPTMLAQEANTDASDRFGTAVDVSADLIAVGAAQAGGGVAQGEVHVFRREATWTLLATKSASSAADNENYGFAVALDGDDLIVGSLAEEVEVRERNQGGTDAWGLADMLVATGNVVGDGFGKAVDADGGRVIAGAPAADVGATTDAGKAYLFRRDAEVSPYTVADSYVVAEGQALVVAAPGVLANDGDANGDALTAIRKSNPASGTLTLGALGDFTYQPTGDFNGTVTFDYSASDGPLESANARVTIEVLPVNDAPVGLPDGYDAIEDQTLVVDGIGQPSLLDNDTDVEGDELEVELVTLPSSGQLYLNPDGTFDYVPERDFDGLVTFQYRARERVSDLPSGNVTVTINVANSNDPPEANDIEFERLIVEGQGTVFFSAPGLLAAASDIDGDVLTPTLEAGSPNAVVVINTLGDFTYTAAPNFSGTDTFEFRVTDPTGLYAIATAILTVTAKEDAPTGSNDDEWTLEGESVVVDVLANDLDLDLDAVLHIVSVEQPVEGGTVLWTEGDDLVTFVPEENRDTEVTFSYMGSDGTTDYGPVAVTIHITPVNDLPVPGDDAFEVVEGTPTLLDVLLNDVEVDTLDSLTITILDNATHGTAIVSNGLVHYTPEPESNLPDSFTYQVEDTSGEGPVGPVTVTIDVIPVNDIPVAQPDDPSTDEDVPVDIDVLANDYDVEGTPLGIASFTQPAHGTVEDLGDGVLRYDPDDDWFGEDTFEYVATDGTDDSEPVTVTVSVTAIPDAPRIADFQAYETDEDAPLVVAPPGVLAGVTDPEGGVIVPLLDSVPAQGEFLLRPNGSFDYTPEPGASGTVTFTWRALDPEGNASEVGIVEITITEVDDPPALAADAWHATEDTTLEVPAPGVLANDVEDGTITNLRVLTAPAHGTLALAPDGSFTYAPAVGWSGDDTFVYEARDDGGQTASATVTLSVAAAPDAPVAAPSGPYATVEDTELFVAAAGVLAGATDQDGDALTARIFDPADHGTVTVAQDGSFVYAPHPEWSGADAFSFVATDGTLDSEPVTVSVTVSAVPDAPVASPDAYVTAEDTPLSVDVADGVLANDLDPDLDALTASLVDDAQHGALALRPDGSFDYTPDPGFSGADAFTYRASDAGTQTAPILVTLTVEPVADPPTVADHAWQTAESTPLSVPAPGVLEGASDSEGAALVAVLGTPPAHGTLILFAGGGFEYVPDEGWFGVDAFTFRADDGGATSAEGTVTLTVTVVNDDPVGQPDAYATDEGVQLVVAAPGLLANDTDADGDPLLAGTEDAPSLGSLALFLDGGFVYTPFPKVSGTDTFTYRAFDPTTGESEPVVVTITIGPMNDAPTAVDDVYVTEPDLPLVVDAALGVLANDTDADGDALTVRVQEPPEHGDLVMAPDGSFTYEADPGYAGPDAFSYVADDGSALSALALVDIGVTGGAGVDTGSTGEDTGAPCVAVTWYPDLDADGFGDPDMAVEACEPPPSHIDAAGDCDDTRASVYPGAREFAADGVDQDCSGADDTVRPEVACATGSRGGSLGLLLALLALGARRRR